MTFKLAALSTGPDPDDWTALQDLIGEADEPIYPEASYMPFQEAVELQSGKLRQLGYPSAVWSFTGLTAEQRYQLRQICPGGSADVYIETMTNEYDVNGDRIWIQAQAIMKWQVGEEDIQADRTMNLEIVFTHMVEVP